MTSQRILVGSKCSIFREFYFRFKKNRTFCSRLQWLQVVHNKKDITTTNITFDEGAKSRLLLKSLLRNKLQRPLKTHILRVLDASICGISVDETETSIFENRKGLVTRGIFTSHFKNSDLWFHGPKRFTTS